MWRCNLGWLAEPGVEEGQLVRKGDRLLVINSDRGSTGGGDVAGRGLGALAVRQQLTEAQVAMADERAGAERGRLTAVIASAEQQALSLRDQIGAAGTGGGVEPANVRSGHGRGRTRALSARSSWSVDGRLTVVAAEPRQAFSQRLTVRSSDAQQSRDQLASVAIDARRASRRSATTCKR